MGQRERDIAAAVASQPDVATISLIGLTAEESRIHREEAKESWAGPEEGRREYPDGTYIDIDYDVDKFTEGDFAVVRMTLRIRGTAAYEGSQDVERYLTYDDYNRWISDGPEVAFSWGMTEREMQVYIASLYAEEAKHDYS